MVMLGETEEYEPLSRAAYYHAMRKIRRKIETLSSLQRRGRLNAQVKNLKIKISSRRKWQ
jgi:hypothetical protein